MAHVGEGVHEGDHFGWIVLERIVRNLIAVLLKGLKVLEQRELSANPLKL